MQIDRKGRNLVTANGGMIFMSGNKDFSYRTSPDLRTDEGWNRRLVVIPIDELSSFDPIRKDPNFLAKLVADAPAVITWVMGMPDPTMVAVGRKAAMITQSLDTGGGTLQKNIQDFLCECVRLDPEFSEKGGFGPTPHY